MSKLTKFIKKPDLFFKDAYIKFNKDLGFIEDKAKKENKISKSTSKIEKEPLFFKRYKPKKYLIIVSNLIDDFYFDFKKYQLASILKYTNFDDIYLISTKGNKKIDDLKSFLDYDSFFKYVVCSNRLDTQYVFIDDFYFFTRPLKDEDLFTSSGKPYLFISKNNFSDINKDVYDHFYINYDCFINCSVVKSFICTTGLALSSSKEFSNNFSGFENYLFNFLPLYMLYFNIGVDKEYKMLFLNFHKDYSKGLSWLLSVRGTPSAPLGVSIFNFIDAEFSIFNDFLPAYYPHLLDEI